MTSRNSFALALALLVTCFASAKFKCSNGKDELHRHLDRRYGLVRSFVFWKRFRRNNEH